jgi:serine/threonine protein kinase
MSARTEYVRTHGQFVGSGCYRNVYKAKTGKYVYKFDSFNHCGEGSNTHEYATYKFLCENYDMPEGVKLPKMELVDGVIVAQYIKGEHPDYCYPQHCYESSSCKKFGCWALKLKNFPVNDLHSDNILVTKDGTIYIIDLGNGSALTAS